MEKLREYLRDGARLVVSEDTVDIERAWDNLETAFRGEEKVIQYRSF